MWTLRTTCCIALFAATRLACGATTIDYAFTSTSTGPSQAPRSGESRVVAVIDGAHFRNTSGRGAVEGSDDDGATTWFGDDRAARQTPLVRESAGATAPIAGSIEDEQLVIGPSTPGPVRFGLPTRVYTVDHRYTIVARLLAVVQRRTRNHGSYTITTADTDVSSAALRVAFSRGYGYALCLHPEAFIGLPLQIDGTIESGDPPFNVAHVRVVAESLRQ